jgi:chaperonin cofactor prefoldin
LAGRESVESLAAEIRELEEAARIIREGRAKTVYLAMGKLFIEVSREEALEYVERRIAALRSLAERMRRERGE